MATLLGAALGGALLMATTDVGIRARAGTVFVVPTTIDNTGVTDVSDALSQWVETQTSDGTADSPNVIALDGVFRVEYGLAIGSFTNAPRDHPTLHAYQRHHMVFDLTRATFVQRDATAYNGTVRPPIEPRKRWGVPILRIDGGSDIHVHGGTLTSTNANGSYSPAREAWAGVMINGTDGIELRGLSISSVWGDFVYVNHGPRSARAHAVLVDGGIYDRNGRQGITFNAVDDLEIRNVRFNNVQRVLFDHEPDRLGGATNVQIHDNLGTSGGLGFMNLQPLRVTPLHDITVANNHLFSGHFRITASGGSGGTPRVGLTITGNTTDTTSPYTGGYLGRTPLISVQGVWDRVVITGNHDVGTAQATAVSVSPVATNVTVAGNDFVGFAPVP